ncbi:MAG: hypothetical protein KDJ52_07065 [Anaerolineae bacterium]|nr:hypothetical protein [Anaerolineae bacterium]
MVNIFVLLLIFFLAAFFGVDLLPQFLGGTQIEVMGVRVASLDNPNLQVILGGAVVFLQFAIIIFSMLGHIGDTIRETIKPVARLFLLGAFLASAYYMFEPIIGPVLFEQQPLDVAAIVTGDTLKVGILLTLGTMILFLMANRNLRTESEEIKALRRELARYRRVLK